MLLAADATGVNDATRSTSASAENATEECSGEREALKRWLAAEGKRLQQPLDAHRSAAILERTRLEEEEALERSRIEALDRRRKEAEEEAEQARLQALRRQREAAEAAAEEHGRMLELQREQRAEEEERERIRLEGIERKRKQAAAEEAERAEVRREMDRCLWL